VERQHDGALCLAVDHGRQAGRLGGKGSGKLPEASTGDTRDRVAAGLGFSGGTPDVPAAAPQCPAIAP
jgi:hypothetical protein